MHHLFDSLISLDTTSLGNKNPPFILSLFRLISIYSPADWITSSLINSVFLSARLSLSHLVS